MILGGRGPATTQTGKHVVDRIQGVQLLIGIIVSGTEITVILFIVAFDCQAQILSDGVINIGNAGMMTEDAAECAVRNAWPVAEHTAGIRAVEEWMETAPVRMKITTESKKIRISGQSMRTSGA